MRDLCTDNYNTASCLRTIIRPRYINMWKENNDVVNKPRRKWTLGKKNFQTESTCKVNFVTKLRGNGYNRICPTGAVDKYLDNLMNKFFDKPVVSEIQQPQQKVNPSIYRTKSITEILSQPDRRVFVQGVPFKSLYRMKRLERITELLKDDDEIETKRRRTDAPTYVDKPTTAQSYSIPTSDSLSSLACAMPVVNYELMDQSSQSLNLPVTSTLSTISSVITYQPPFQMNTHSEPNFQLQIKTVAPAKNYDNELVNACDMDVDVPEIVSINFKKADKPIIAGTPMTKIIFNIPTNNESTTNHLLQAPTPTIQFTPFVMQPTAATKSEIISTPSTPSISFKPTLTQMTPTQTSSVTPMYNFSQTNTTNARPVKKGRRAKK
jgi:hypothetical protein